MPVEVNSAAVRWSNVQLPGEISPSPDGEKSAEAIVVEETSRSAHEHSKDAGETHPMKDRTNEEGIDPVTDGPTDNARRRGESESQHGEKHGAPQERTMIEEILELECPKGSDRDILKKMRSQTAWTERSGVKTSRQRGNA